MLKPMPVALAAALLLSACVERTVPVASAAPPPALPPPATPASLSAAPTLGPNGGCANAPASTAATIQPGIAECDLVRLKGRDPTDVLVGESGKGQREVQVLYSEPGGRELYFFIDNRLDRIVK